jgi:hypothetical protein
MSKQRVKPTSGVNDELLKQALNFKFSTTPTDRTEFNIDSILADISTPNDPKPSNLDLNILNMEDQATPSHPDPSSIILSKPQSLILDFRPNFPNIEDHNSRKSDDHSDIKRDLFSDFVYSDINFITGEKIISGLESGQNPTDLGSLEELQRNLKILNLDTVKFDHYSAGGEGDCAGSDKESETIEETLRKIHLEKEAVNIFITREGPVSQEFAFDESWNNFRDNLFIDTTPRGLHERSRSLDNSPGVDGRPLRKNSTMVSSSSVSAENRIIPITLDFLGNSDQKTSTMELNSDGFISQHDDTLDNLPVQMKTERIGPKSPPRIFPYTASPLLLYNKDKSIDIKYSPALKTRKIRKGKKSRSFLMECALDDPNNFDKQRFNMLLKEIESNHINQIDFMDQKNNIRRNQKKFQLRKLNKDFPETPKSIRTNRSGQSDKGSS